MNGENSITFYTGLDNRQLEKDLASTKRKIQAENEKIYKYEQEKLPLLKQSEKFSIALDQAKQTLFDMQNASVGTYDSSSIQEQSAMVRQMQSEYNKVENRIDSINNAIRRANVSVDAETEKAGALEIELAKAAEKASRLGQNTRQSSKAMQEMEKRTRRFNSRMREIVSGALFFNIISRGMTLMVQWTGNVIKTNEDARASIARLKGALLTLAQPILNVVIPAFVQLVNILTRVISVIASLISRLFGSTAKKSADAAKSLNQQAEGYGGVSEAAKDAAKSVMGFDELNTLQEDINTDNGGGGGSIGDSIAPDFSGFDSDLITKEVEELTVYLSGALLALGAVLTFSGANIPLGLGLLAVGALGLASVIVPNWNSMDGEVKKAVNAVLMTLAVSGLAIGAILAFSGANIPLGIGLMAVGALSVATATALNWDSIRPHLGEALVSVEMVLGAALLGIGAVLAFTGVSLGLGIAMMAVGAVGLARSQTIDWDAMEKAMRGPVGKITAIASGALLALGLILAFSGVSLPIGIGMIFAGCAGLVTAASVNWDTILDKLKGTWRKIEQWFSSNVAPKLTVSYWQKKLDAIGTTASNVGQSIKDGFLAAFNNTIQSFSDFMSTLIDGLQWLVDQAAKAFSFISRGQAFSNGYVAPADETPYSMNTAVASIPQLARGAIIPPNREFLAVLGDQSHGTNIEAPADLIRQIVREEAGGSEEQLRLLKDQNELLRQILDKTGFSIDGKSMWSALAPYQRQAERARGW